MKKLIFLFAAIITGLMPALAQFGPPAGAGPHFDSSITMLFGTNQSFSATMELQAAENNLTVPGKIVFDSGKSRFEMNFSEIAGSGLSSSLAAQMKSMGMDAMIAITRPDLKLSYFVYPGLNSYASMPSGDSAGSTNDCKLTVIEVGKETIDGHACIKNKAVVTDKDGSKHESTIWNAGDLGNFPVKIVTIEDNGKTITRIFKNVSFGKPAASAFEAPSGYTKYDDVQTMLNTEVMKKMSGTLGTPAH